MEIRVRIVVAAVGILLAVAGSQTRAAAAVSFTPLGTLPGDPYLHSVGYDVSADGSVVVGRSSGGDITEAFRWTAETGMVGLGDLTGGMYYSDGYGVFGDGSTVVGRSSSQYSSEGNKEAFRWTAEGGMDGIGDFWGGPFSSEAHGASADGSVVVGLGTIGDVGTIPTRAFRWTEETGLVSLGTLPGVGGSSRAFACAEDGSAVVGDSTNNSWDNEAFRWTADSGMVALGDLAGGEFDSTATAISADGSVVTGNSHVGLDPTGRYLREVFRWTEDQGMVGLGFYGEPEDCSADGSVIVGKRWGVPFIFDPVHGARDLDEVLTAGGVDLTGWTIWRAYGISADGNTIVGCAYNPDGNLEAYVAHIPEPASLGLLGIGTAIVWRRRLR